VRILIAPDKFKGSLDAAQAAEAIRDGFRRVFPEAAYVLAPIADGGEGTAAIFRNELGGELVEAAAHDALGRPIKASYTWQAEKKLAVIEMSEASGLWRLQPAERDPLKASTFGTGELMADAVARGAEAILVTLGGSATNDAGVGMAAALGWKFLDAAGNEMMPLPLNFPGIRDIVPPRVPPACTIKALCDVDNPLLGPEGATRVYGRQKGATPEMIGALEEGLAHVADVCRDKLNRDFRDAPGAGATGGLGFGLMTFGGATLARGFAVVSDLMKLDRKIAEADLVLTGEGKLDTQSLHGKGPLELARLAKRAGKPVIAFAGHLEHRPAEIDAAIPIANRPLALAESQLHGAQLLRDAAERTARLLKISL